MKSILRFLTNRWLLSSLGLGAAAAAIWLVGPLVGVGSSRPLESATARIVVILVVVLLWALNQLRKVLKANQANKGMVEGLVAESAAEPDRSAEEVATLKQRFEEAVAVLKKAKGKKGRLNLYDLPWYIIIGPPGSGKTTALVNSGLDFPLAERFGREALGGVGGTRNCDWWFTDEAILLDTAGRYTTQDSDADVDRSAWEGFLALLKKYRRRRPINGVIVAISLLDLMTLSEHDRIAHARAIRTRIQELDEYFKIRFPVYVMLTKCDLVAGFMEFFDDLGRPEREQVWGATFPIEVSDSAEGAVDRFGPELDALLGRLNARLLWRMSQEQDPRRRAAIYGFPRQLGSLKQNLDAFLGDVFRGSRYEEAPMLRGVYFTSGTQEGTPIDRLMGAVARSFGLDQRSWAAQGGQGRSYFIKSLLTNVVFAESEVAGTNRRLELQRAWLQKAAYAGSIALALIMVVGWTVSYVRNGALVREVEAATNAASEAVAAVPRDDRDLLAVLPALDAVKAIPAAYTDSGAPWLMGLGLYQGRKLADRSDLAYRRVLTELLLPRLMFRLEQQLRTGGPTPDFQYEALKVYLMLDSPEHYSAAEITGWFNFDLDQDLARRVGTPQRDALLAHVDALFAERPAPLPVPLDQELIEQTQLVVARMSPEQRIYNRLKRRATGEDLEDFSLFRAAGPRSQIAFVRRSGAAPTEGIDGFFTREGYRRFFTSQSELEADVLIDESWILGPYAPTGLDAEAVLEGAKGLYLDEFSRQYEGLLADLQLAPFATPEEASSTLNVIADSVASPLVLLLKAVAAEAELEPRADGAEPSIGARARSTVERLEGLLGGGSQRPAQAAESAVSVVDQRLGWVRQMVDGPDPAALPVSVVLSRFDELYQFMAVVVTQRGLSGDIPAPVADQGRVVVQTVRTEAVRQPAMIRSLLEDAADRVQLLAFRGVSAHINTQWRSEALPFCRQAIAGRYPIERSSAQEIRLDDFGRFFAPGGLADAFFREYIADYVDMSRRPWRSRASAAAPLRISPEALQQFERAAAIRDTFFRAGGNLPSVAFELQPVGMDATINQFTLDLEGQRITYSFGPLLTTPMQWPGPQRTGEVRIEMTPPSADGSSLRREQGPWAWFRMLDRANVTPTDDPEAFEVEFRLGERAALYRLTASSANNPFSLPDLLQFRCPETL